MDVPLLLELEKPAEGIRKMGKEAFLGWEEDLPDCH